MVAWTAGRLARYVREWQRRSSFEVAPVVLNLPVTDNCNARCIMCDVWKEPSAGDFTVDALERWLRLEPMRRLVHVGLSGGEPTLRRDLPDIFSAVCEGLPRLRSISITTHGFHPKRWLKLAPVLQGIASRHRVPLRVNVSVDGVGEIHDRVRRVPGGWRQVETTIDTLLDLGIELQLQCTVSRANVYFVGQTLSYARARELDIIFRVATEIERLGNLNVMQDAALDQDERSFFADFLLSDALLGWTTNPARRLLYRDIARRLESGGARRAPCSFQQRGLMLSPTGQVYQCSLARRPLADLAVAEEEFRWNSPPLVARRTRFVAERCPSCIHDQTGHWPAGDLMHEVLLGSRIGRPVERATRALAIGRMAMRLRNPDQEKEAERPIPPQHALLVGAYGGEHVGDAAILAGVCQRLNRELGITAFTVASSRPGRTRRWVRSLRLPTGCEIAVVGFQEVQRAHLEETVCYAGGPLMDLPLVNLRSAALMAQARALGALVRIEGVGIGPFRGRLGASSVRRILACADYISVRTPADAELCRGLGRSPDMIGSDPAEDYVASGLWKGSETPTEAIERQVILEKAQGRPVVLWNLRPLSIKYSDGTALHLADVQRRIREEIRLAVRSSSALHHVFFPMNADQYGSSDLDEVREVTDQCGEVDVVNRELGVGAVLELMSRAHAVVSMRFHGCVFATALGRPLVAIDYGIGAPQKVSRLMNRCGASDFCRTVDTVDAPWLMNRLRDALAGAGAVRSPHG